MLAWAQGHHLQASCFGRLVGVSPGDLGRLSIMGREGISDDDGVLRRDHPRVPGHRDGSEYVVTWSVTVRNRFFFGFVQCSNKLHNVCTAPLSPPPLIPHFYKYTCIRFSFFFLYNYFTETTNTGADITINTVTRTMWLHGSKTAPIRGFRDTQDGETSHEWLKSLKSFSASVWHISWYRCF